MELTVLPDTNAVAQAAARMVAAEANSAIAARGRFVMALSGGSTPWKMIAALAREKMQWDRIHLLQVDERVAPEGHEERNLTHMLASLAEHSTISARQIHAMPVNDADLGAACRNYARLIAELTAPDGQIDLVHLGLGGDGHTASLVPHDPVLQVTDSSVALTELYQDRVRMTLTYPVINSARKILWLVTGEGKVAMLRRLLAQDSSIPAGRVGQANAVVFADAPACPSPPSG